MMGISEIDARKKCILLTSRTSCFRIAFAGGKKHP